jgi:CHAT domain
VNGSPDREENLFQDAVRAYKAGDLEKARILFRQVVALKGRRRAEAQRYLELISRLSGAGSEPRAREARRGVWKRVEGKINEVAGAGKGDLEQELGSKVENTLGRPGHDLSMAAPAPMMRELESAEAPAAPEILRRTPHMDLDPQVPVAEGERIQVSVYTDAGARREGEEGDDVAVELPAGEDHVVLSVWLVVEAPFSVEGPDIRRLTLRRDQERSEPAVFTVVRKGPATAPAATFSALFAYRGRACGRVSRTVAISADMAGAPDDETSRPDPIVRVETGARQAALNVRIVASGLDGRTFQCHVETPLLLDYLGGATEEWGLKSLAAELVGQQMDQFVKAADNWSRTVALRAAGLKLFEAAPRIFQKVLWELIDTGNEPDTISIVTEEPSIPWELMVPNRRLPNGKVEKREPLGVTCLVSRWTSQQHVLPAQKLSLKDAYVVAPRDSRLGAAEEEAALVMGQFHGERIDPASPRALDQKLDQHGPALLHFVCHGKSGDAGCQTLLLDQKQVLRADSLSGMEGVTKGLGDGKPLVFLNACEVGRQEPALVGTGGFAEEFMALGASAVIAPLWSVKDTIAHEIALELYRRIKAEPSTPFTAILRDLRAKSYALEGGEDTYAAYCFYGDPLATAG